MSVLATTIYAGEALFAYTILGYGLTTELRAIRHIDRVIRRHLRSRYSRGLFPNKFAIGWGSCQLVPGSDVRQPRKPGKMANNDDQILAE